MFTDRVYYNIPKHFLKCVFTLFVQTNLTDTARERDCAKEELSVLRQEKMSLEESLKVLSQEKKCTQEKLNISEVSISLFPHDKKNFQIFSALCLHLEH